MMLDESGISDLVGMLRMTAESFTLNEQILLKIYVSLRIAELNGKLELKSPFSPGGVMCELPVTGQPTDSSDV